MIRHSIACAAEDDVGLGQRQGLARGDEHLLADDVDPRDLLGDGVLDLHARVHLEEVVGPVPREQALDRAGRPITDRARRVDGDRADPLAQRVVDGRRRRLLDELLMAPLDRAVPLAEVNHVSVGVREDLHLDVTWILEVPLDVDGGIREVRLALALRASSYARSTSSGDSATRSPFPPPPADAFTATG